MISASGMSAQQLAMDTISNNLANVNTTGFKASQAKFADVFYQQVHRIDGAQGSESAGPSQGLGVKHSQIQRVFTQGTVEATGNPLDLAVQGEGFFQVIRPDNSIGYTRDGSFSVNSQGILCTAQGYPLSPQIEIPSDTTEVQIGADGTVAIKRVGDMMPREIAQLELAQFINPGGLESLGNNVYAMTSASGDTMAGTPGDDGLGSIAQGNLERSNVNLVQEMVNMIITQRAYEVNTKSIQAADEMLKMANNIKRG